MHSRSLVVVVAGGLAVASASAVSLVGCSIVDGDVVPSGSEERARLAVAMGLMTPCPVHGPHDKPPHLSFCQDECLAGYMKGCSNVWETCNDDDNDGHVVASGYVIPCDKAKELACGGIPYVHDCMDHCSSWF